MSIIESNPIIERYNNAVEHVMRLKKATLRDATLRDATLRKTLTPYVKRLKVNQENILESITISNKSIVITESSRVYNELVDIANHSLEILSIYHKKSEMSIVEENAILFKKKNQDYGSSFEDFAIIGIIVRLNDKINRILNLSKCNNQSNMVDERIEDTINDLYNYCIIGLMYNI